MERIKGILWGLLSGASFGLIPLFTLPLFMAGLATDSILCYRFTAAALIIGIILLLGGESFRITFGEFLRLVILALFYLFSSLFLLIGYQYMDAGIATVIHFLYPVFVLVLMGLFFGERVSLLKVVAVLLAISGVVLLWLGADGSGGGVALSGVIIVALSALAYALYIIGIKKLGLGRLSGLKMTFFVMTITGAMFALKVPLSGADFSPLVSMSEMINICLLGFIPTVVSNFALVRSVGLVGSTATSILGAMEPVTAVAVGAIFFAEPLSGVILAGIFLIVGAVAMIVGR